MAVDQAIGLAKTAKVNNVTFQAGDTYALDFADKTFDVTYSLNVLVHIREPVRALREQARVTKRGGWVVGSLGDWGAQIIYPPCPAVERVWAALPHLNDPSDPDIFVNFNLGREAVALLSQAGLTDIGIQAGAVGDYPGSERFDYRYRTLRGSRDWREGAHAPWLKKLVALGLLDEETILATQEELDAWHAHPHAFYLQAGVFAAGRVA